ncbi:type IV pilin protein [Caldimonas brevitalea]|uniref:type IV pilin protein n=1 Tax=Caldimonas brevitalea TaxID=413882 RepID=UPI001EEF627A
MVELLIVVAIIGIISAVAYPSYQEQVKRGRRSDAQTVLLEASQFMQRHYAAQNTFLGATLPDNLTTAPKGTGDAASYTIEISEDTTARTFKLVASPQGNMDADRCGDLTLTDTGVRGATGSGATVAECWR